MPVTLLSLVGGSIEAYGHHLINCPRHSLRRDALIKYTLADWPNVSDVDLCLTLERDEYYLDRYLFTYSKAMKVGSSVALIVKGELRSNHKKD